MEQENFYLNFSYKNKTILFNISEPNLSLEKQMEKLRKATDKDGKLIFDMPLSRGDSGPVEYFFGKTDENGEPSVFQPKKGNNECCFADYNVKNGDTLEIIMDPIAG